jgi:hypothetical protein
MKYTDMVHKQKYIVLGSILVGFVLGIVLTRPQFMPLFLLAQGAPLFAETAPVPTSVRIAATLVEARPENHALLVDFHNPYVGGGTWRALIHYEDSATLRTDTEPTQLVASAKIGSLRPGSALFLNVGRGAGELQTSFIYVFK